MFVTTEIDWCKYRFPSLFAGLRPQSVVPKIKPRITREHWLCSHVQCFVSDFCVESANNWGESPGYTILVTNKLIVKTADNGGPRSPVVNFTKARFWRRNFIRKRFVQLCNFGRQNIGEKEKCWWDWHLYKLSLSSLKNFYSFILDEQICHRGGQSSEKDDRGVEEKSRRVKSKVRIKNLYPIH